MTEEKTTFEKLVKLSVNEHTEKKEGLTYLSWAWAWSYFKQTYPDANYIIRNWDDKPYLFDEDLGYLVSTSITAGGQCHSMWLPVMDAKNKAMKDKPYEYKTQFGPKTVNAATMFDINTAIMRCLVKNMAMFGLGLYIYAGEDLPQQEVEMMTPEQKAELLALGADFNKLLAYWKVTSEDQVTATMAQNLIIAKKRKMDAENKN